MEKVFIVYDYVYDFITMQSNPQSNPQSNLQDKITREAIVKFCRMNKEELWSKPPPLNEKFGDYTLIITFK